MKNNRQNQSSRRGGFTLVEVMAVLLILAITMGLGVVAIQGRVAKARKSAAFTYVKTLETAVKGYETDMGRAPTTEQGLAALITVPADVPNPGSWGGPYIESTATSKDPWGMEYQYVSPGRDGRPFDIWSYGPDMIDGTADDIGTWMGSLN